jgi:hypothetical protein
MKIGRKSTICGAGGSFTMNGITGQDVALGFIPQGSVDGVSVSIAANSTFITASSQDCYLIAQTNPSQFSFNFFFGSGCSASAEAPDGEIANYWTYYFDPTSGDAGTLVAY